MEALKRVLELLYKDKQLEEQPKRLEIKSRDIITPEERESFNQWCRELNVSILYERNNEFG